MSSPQASNNPHPITTLNPPNVPAPPPTYHQLAIAPLHPTSRLVVLAGQIGQDPDPARKNTPLPPTVAEQAAIAYANIRACLAAVPPSPGGPSSGGTSGQSSDGPSGAPSGPRSGGASPRDIVQVKHYIVKDTGDPEVDALDVVDRGWGKVWMDFMDREAGGHRPPDTVIGVASLAKKEILYECEVWAVVH